MAEEDNIQNRLTATLEQLMMRGPSVAFSDAAYHFFRNRRPLPLQHAFDPGSFRGKNSSPMSNNAGSFSLAMLAEALVSGLAYLGIFGNVLPTSLAISSAVVGGTSCIILALTPSRFSFAL